MRIETDNIITEDSLDKLVLNRKGTYECACGEPRIHGMHFHTRPGSRSYQYSFTCDCGNKIKVLVKDIWYKDPEEDING
jgi:hypothetical protein